MTYDELKLTTNDAYSDFIFQYVKEIRIGADHEKSKREYLFVKVLYKVILNQVGDETVDSLTKLEIQNIIIMFNKYSNSVIPIEYE